MTETTQPVTRQRYDTFTLILHWVTAASVIFLFTSAHIREQLEPFRFFGLFDLTGWVAVTPSLRHTLAQWHRNVAWALIALASAHALAALFHHYLLRDGVLRRMLPGRAFR